MEQSYAKPDETSAVKRFYQKHKETILITGLIVLAVKNSALKSDNRRLVRDLREAKEVVDDARIQLEAIRLMEQIRSK